MDMDDNYSPCGPPNLYKFDDEEGSSITGGKSVSEIVQLLRTKAKIKIAKDLDDSDEVDDHPNRNQMFPWMKKFNISCKEVMMDPNLKKLIELVTEFYKNVEEDVKKCYTKPKRANKLKLLMNSFLYLFHTLFVDLKKPLDRLVYLEKMSDIMALYIDIELKSSRRGREHPKKISERICSSLYLFLDDSPDHMLDSILKAKFFIKKYSDICLPIISKLLKQSPGPIFENTYVRYLLSFKVWKKLAGIEHFQDINEQAVAKLQPPPDFAEKLKSGLFANVLPYVSKSEKDRLTMFFMQSPFNVKKKAQIFLKDEKKLQPTLDVEKSFLFDDDQPINSFFDDDSEGGDSAIFNTYWTTLVEEEDDIEDFITLESYTEEDKVFIDLTNTSDNEKPNKTSNEKSNKRPLKTFKKRKTLKVNSSNMGVKNLLKRDSSDGKLTEDSKLPMVSMIPKEEKILKPCAITGDILKLDEKTSSCSEPVKPLKPCATVEPEQSKEVCPNSHSRDVEVLTTNQLLKTTPLIEASFNETSKSSTKDSQVNPNIEPSTSLTASGTGNMSNTLIEEVDSSGLCEEVKLEVDTNDVFVVDQIFKGCKDDEHRLLEDQLVAEEVVIGTETSQYEGSTTFLIVESDSQGKIDQQGVINVINFSREVSLCPLAEPTGQTHKSHQVEVVPLLESPNLLNNTNNNCTKEHSTVSPENHQFLSSIVASAESTDNYVSLNRRQDSYTYNDIMLTRLFSEVNADEGSDDDTRYHNRSQYAGGGKIAAFNSQDDQKSDIGEELDPTSSPSSQSDSQRSVSENSPETANSHPASMELSSQDVNHEIDSSGPIPLSDEIPPKLKVSPEDKSARFDPCQMREVSVNLPYMTELGKRGSSRHSSSHIMRKKVNLLEPAVCDDDYADDNIPLFSTDNHKVQESKDVDGPLKKKRNITRSVSLSKSKSKSNQLPPPTVVKPPFQPAAKKRRSRRKR